MDSEASNPLSDAAKAIRDAAKYLVATFGAIGAVLVSGLSLTAMPSGASPVVAALGIAGAVLALALLIGLAISVLTPKAITLGGLAELEEAGSSDSVVERLKADEALFAGQKTNLKAFHADYVQALKDRVQANEEYLVDPDEAHRTTMEIASSRAQVLNEASGQFLETAVLFQLEERFSLRRRALMTALALCVVAGAGVFAWASTSPSPDPEPQQAQEPSTERIWLEHLLATSGFRIERLEREAENASKPSAQRRVGRALALQRGVNRRQERVIEQLAATNDPGSS
jgi:hypothetical protein